jgi:hypothetical protein
MCVTCSSASSIISAYKLLLHKTTAGDSFIVRLLNVKEEKQPQDKRKHKTGMMEGEKFGM